MGIRYNGMEEHTQLGELISTALHGTRIPKRYHLPSTSRNLRDHGWQPNQDNQRGRIATTGLGAVGVREAMVGLGRSGYRDGVRGCSNGAWDMGCLSSQQELDCVSWSG